MRYPKISVVTICLNHKEFLEETMLSVLGQHYPNLEYIIIDGGSTDGSVEVIKKYEKQLAYWVSEPDNGHVYALEKGLQKATGEIMCWINSDDKLHPNSLFTVAEIFSSFPEVQWLTGYPTWFNESGFPLAEMPVTEYMWKYWMKAPNFYLKFSRWSKLRFYNYDFLAIQQESTFWRKELWDKAGGKIDTNYKLAFEMELWCRFFRHAELYTVDAILGGFRMGNGAQQSIKNLSKYMDECNRAVKTELTRIGFAGKLNSKMRFLPALFFKPFYYYNVPLLQKVYAKLLKLPPLIRHDFSAKQYILQSV